MASYSPYLDKRERSGHRSQEGPMVGAPGVFRQTPTVKELKDTKRFLSMGSDAGGREYYTLTLKSLQQEPFLSWRQDLPKLVSLIFVHHPPAEGCVPPSLDRSHVTVTKPGFVFVLRIVDQFQPPHSRVAVLQCRVWAKDPRRNPN